MAAKRKASALTPAQRAEVAAMIEEALTLSPEDIEYLDRKTDALVKEFAQRRSHDS